MTIIMGVPQYKQLMVIEFLFCYGKEPFLYLSMHSSLWYKITHWRDVRAAEGARLEIVCAGKTGTEGSNPSLSARITTKLMKLELAKWVMVPLYEIIAFPIFNFCPLTC
jgi:hypothetical protein